MDLGRLNVREQTQSNGTSKMELNPKLELIVTIIKNSELDCNMWCDSAQRELAVEILEALEARFVIDFKDE